MTTLAPPMLSGAKPGLGHAIEFRKDLPGLMSRGYAEHGEVFAIKLANQNAAVVSGAANNRVFFTETDKALDLNKAYEFLKAAFGEWAFTLGPAGYNNHRPMLQELFNRERMVSHIVAIDAEVDRWIDGLGPFGQMNISAEMSRLTQFVAARAFVGPSFRTELDENFWSDYALLAASLDPLMPPNLPLPKFIKRDRARKRMVERFIPVVQRRRANPEKYDDLVTHMTQAVLVDGGTMTDREITEWMIGLLFAGHETTAGQAAWSVILLLQHPEYLSTVISEIDANAPRDSKGQIEQLNGSTLRSLPHVYYAVDETTRLRPSAEITIRTAMEDVDFGDYRVPADWIVFVNAENSHGLAGEYTDPEKFDPLRFSTERNEGAPTDIVGFGGGTHKCTGINFAKHEMAAVITRLFGTLELNLATKDPFVDRGLGASKPSPTIIEYELRS